MLRLIGALWICSVVRATQIIEAPALAKIIVYVSHQTIVTSSDSAHKLQRRQAVSSTNAVCSSACSLYNEALHSCSDDACFCPFVTVDGTPCSECYATVNITAASIISNVISICHSEFAITTSSSPPLTTSASFGFGTCSSECELISAALSACTDDACFCPPAIVGGSSCSACLAKTNITQAADISSALSICSNELLSTDTITTSSAFNSASILPFSVTSSSSSATAVASSGSSGLSGGAIGGIVGGVVGGVLVLAIIGFLIWRHNRNPRPRPPVSNINIDEDTPPPPKNLEAGVSELNTNQYQYDEVPSGRLRYPEEIDNGGMRAPEPVSGRLSNNQY